MMLATALAIAVTLPVMPAGVFPEIALRKGETAHEWPFSVDEGKLTCVEYGGRQTVIFTDRGAPTCRSSRAT